MNLQEFRTALGIIDDALAPVGAVLHLLQKNGDIRKADMTDELQTELKEVFYGSIKRKYINDGEFRVENLSTALETLNTAFFYDLPNLPKDLLLIESFNPWDESHKKFSISDDGIEHAKALLITIGNSTGHLTINKHVHSFTVIRKAKLMSIVPFGDRLDILKENVLNITGSIDFLYISQKLIVDNVRTLSLNYGYHDIVKNQAKARIEGVITDLGLIENINVLTDFINNPKYAKKVMKIQPDSPVMNLDTTKIVKFIKKHDKLKGKFRFAPSGKIMLDTDVSKISMINILNDAYVKSQLTGIDYEAESKAEMKEED
jgi:hypothetical protein